ncbi:MAG: PspC domain-containing protein [Oscillospiraceae bacterium]|nr:PspC domain-containing protein [Oscillospiraceae bacterium]
MKKKLYRSKSDQKLAGVCGGVAEYLGIDSTLVRLVWALFVLCAGTGVLAYIACALIIPEKPEDEIIDV